MKSERKISSSKEKDLEEYIGLAKKFIRVFPEDVVEKPEETFWPIQYIRFNEAYPRSRAMRSYHPFLYYFCCCCCF